MYEWRMPPTLKLQAIFGMWKQMEIKKKIFDKWSTYHRASSSKTDFKGLSRFS